MNLFKTRFQPLVLLIAGSCVISCSQRKEITSYEKPNVILIMADDMGIECMNYYGNTEYQTPGIDRLASNGVRFDNCFAQPLCTPSRVKIMTGKHNFRNYEDFGWLNPDQLTFGNLMKEAGYSTSVAGKWQLNGINMNNPDNQDVNRPYQFGFDEYCLWQLHHKRSAGERYADPLITKNGVDLPRNEDAYGPDIFSDYICDFITRNANNPFFIYYPMVLIHDPFVPTPDSPEWSIKERRYEDDTAYVADMVAYVDKIVLRIENCLKENNIWENTILIFTGDNGTRQGVFSQTNKGNIQGGKGKTINSGIRVPMVVSWPKYVNQGKIVNDPIDFADFLPTLADIAGIPPDAYSTDGISFKNAILNTEVSQKKEVFIHYSPRWGEPGNKYGRKSEHTRFVTNGVYKLYRNGDFFDTTKDPDELLPLDILTQEETKIRTRYDSILSSKEIEYPFSWNDSVFFKKN
jgi:arylsulfatase A